MRRLQEEIQKQATDSDHDVTAITLALTAGFQHTKATMALQVRLGPICTVHYLLSGLSLAQMRPTIPFDFLWSF